MTRENRTRVLTGVGTACLVVCLGGPGGLAGSASAVAVQATPNQQPSRPVFRTGTTLIEVDAMVKDRQGRFVDDLTRDDFELLEDGVAQKIEAFYLVKDRQVQRIPGTAPTPPVSPIRPLTPVMAEPPVQRVLVLFFDVDHMGPGGFDRARKAAEQFVTTEFLPGDIGGVIANATMVNGRLTNVREELLAAVKSVKAAGTAGTMAMEMRQWPRLLDPYEVFLIDRNDREAIDRAVQRACSDDPSGCGTRQPLPVDQIVKEKARQLISGLRATGIRTMQALTGLANGLARLPGRKSIILFSDGFFTEDSWGNLRAITDLSARASVRIYALDTRGLNRGSASSDIFALGPHGDANPAGEVTGFDTGSDGPNSLAVDTGGLVIRNENDFPKALREFAEDTNNYYVLGYLPTNTRFDGAFRKVTVRTRRPGLTVRARRGYLATPDRIREETVGATGAPPVAAPAPGGGTGVPAVAVPPPTGVTAPLAGNVPLADKTATVLTPTVEAEPMAVRARPHVGTQVDELTTIGGSGAKGPAGLPDDLRRQARDGWEAYQRGDLKAASTALGLAAAHPAAPPWIHYALGWSQYAEAEYPAAGVQWEHVREQVPEFEPVYFALADSYLQQREFGKAVTVLRDAQGRWPKDVEVYNALGVIQTGRGALNEAIATFEQAVAVNMKDPTACYNLARTLELRHHRLLTQRRSTQAGLPVVFPDRDRAIEYYLKTVALGGPLKEAAEAALERLRRPES
jgi:VWFA-related protein